MNLPRQLPKSTVRAVLFLALPVLAEQFLAVGVGLVDTWLTGNYLPGDKYLAAIGQMAYLMWLIPSLFSFVSVGATALVSRFTGAENQKLANQTTNQAILLGGIMAVAVTVWLYVGGDWLIGVLQLPEDAAVLAGVYLRYLIPAIPAIMFERIAIACLHGAGDTISAMFVRITVNVCNILLSLAFVVGWGPLPAMGWGGIALGTSLSHFVGASILLVMLIRGRSGLQLRWRELRLQPTLAARLLRIGIPGGIDVMLVLICHLWFVALINGLGTSPAAAHSLALRIESLGYLPCTAFQVAATTLVGQCLGARDTRRASRSVMVSVLLAASVMSLAGVVFYVAGFSLATFFTGGANPVAAQQAAALLRIASFVMPVLAISIVVGGALRGAGDTRWPMVINIACMLGIRITAMYLLLGYSPLADWAKSLAPANPNHGVLQAAWMAMLLDVAVRAVLVSTRFFQGGWKQTEV